MSTEAWIFLVGFRVFDVGLLIVWLLWFFRRGDDGSGGEDGDGGGGGGGGGPKNDPAPRPGGGGLGLLKGRVPPGSGRLRDGHRLPRSPLPRRRTAPARAPLPARVRSPGAPARVTRRA